MSGWEEHANRSLQSLADALQRGQIDLQEYRARRRRVLQGVRERCLQTQRHRPAAPGVGAPAAPTNGHSRSALVLILYVMLTMGLLLCIYVLAVG